MLRTWGALIFGSSEPGPSTAGLYGVAPWATGRLVGLMKLGRSVAALISYKNPRRIEVLVWSDSEFGGVAKSERIVS